MPVPSSWSSPLLSVLRIVAGIGFLHHGTSKFFDLPPYKLELTALLSVAGAIELVGGTLLILGLFTRPAAFLMSGLSAVAYFTVHASRGFFPKDNGGEPAMLYAFVFLYLAAAGGGVWSLDAARRRRGPSVRT